MNDRFHERLAQALDALGISQTDLANVTGVSPQAVHQWISGESRPKTSRLQQIIRELNVSERWLLWGEGHMEATTSRDQNATGDHPDYGNSVARIDKTSGRKVPLVDLEDILVSEDRINLGDKTYNRRKIETKFPCGENSLAFIVRDKSMEPKLHQGDIVIIDPDLQPVPEDLIVVYLIDRQRNIFRQFTFGTNGEVLLVPLNPKFEAFRFSASEWLEKVFVVGVMSEFSSPRRT
jgi:phage repressor protein C with HTH and peptisase S24 domain